MKKPLSRKERSNSPALTLTIRYVLFGMLWILFSDSVLSWVSHDSLLWQLAHVHILKGVLFIGVTGGAIFHFVHNLHQELVAKKRDYLNLFDDNPYPLVFISPESFSIINANEAATSLLGFSANRLRQMNFCELISEQDRGQFRTELSMQRVSFQFRKSGIWNFRMKEGHICFVRVDTVHLATSRGDQLVLALHNLTAQITAERELKELAQFLEQHITQRTAHLTRLNEELAFRARETEKVNSELIFINERLQIISKEQSASHQKIGGSAAVPLERNPDAVL